MDSTEPVRDGLTPTERAAARGELPDWARVSVRRREHMGRVAALLDSWARQLGFGAEEALRWSAAGWLHDALRDANPAELGHEVGAAERDLPGGILHGPAAAARLTSTIDPRVVNAIRYHTIGHPSLDELGRALYLADFLEPGREFAAEWRATLRDRMPRDRREVLIEVLAARIGHLLQERKLIRPETAAFWSAVVGEGKSEG